jgi:flagellar biogenesis protein FliO
MKLSDIKDIADVIQALFTSLAFIIGGAWTYLLFVRKRQRFPRAKIEHQITQRAAKR